MTLKRESEYLETQYPKLFFSDCILNILENIHPGIHMGEYLIPWGEVTSLSWSLFLLLQHMHEESELFTSNYQNL